MTTMLDECAPCGVGRECRAVSDDPHSEACARDGDVEAALVREETDAAVATADGGEENDVLLAALEGVLGMRERK